MVVGAGIIAMDRLWLPLILGYYFHFVEVLLGVTTSHLQCKPLGVTLPRLAMAQAERANACRKSLGT